MNAAETIQAAIDKLIKLRQQSTPGDWGILDGGDRFIAWHDDPASTGFDYVADEPVEFSKPANGELICTLHATIDAQLHILRAGRALYYGSFGNEVPPELRDAALGLAQAILGEQNND